MIIVQNIYIFTVIYQIILKKTRKEHIFQILFLETNKIFSTFENLLFLLFYGFMIIKILGIKKVAISSKTYQNALKMLKIWLFFSFFLVF